LEADVRGCLLGAASGGGEFDRVVVDAVRAQDYLILG